MRLLACFRTGDDYPSRDNRVARGASRKIGFIPGNRNQEHPISASEAAALLFTVLSTASMKKGNDTREVSGW
jgi:hypothetical protein